MKTTFFILLTIICQFVFSQEIILKENTSLVYEAKDATETLTIAAQFKSISPAMVINWSKNNRYNDKGTLIYNQTAQQNAINYTTMFPVSPDPIEMFDQMPLFLLNKKLFSELKKNKKTQIRIDCDFKVHELLFGFNEKFTVKINGKETEVNAIKAVYGPFSDEIWILDNDKFPLILKIKRIQQITLKEITL